MLKPIDLQGLLDQMAAAYSAGDAEGCARMFSANAQVHSPFAPPAIGRAAIQSLHEDWVVPPAQKRFSLLDSGACEKMAWALCRYSESGSDEKGPSLIVWEMDDVGGWLIRSCCLHGDPEPE